MDPPKSQIFRKLGAPYNIFARIVRRLWRNQSQDWIPLIHTHHIPVGADEEITSDLTTRLGRGLGLMRNPIGADIYNPAGRGAFAQTQDQQWLLAGKSPFSSWVARTIFLHSLNQGAAAGISRAELNLSLLTPGLEISFIDQVSDQLSSLAWYLDDDPATSRSRFKEDRPNNLLRLMRELKEKTKALVLLTATPMQIDAVEIFDRLDLLGLKSETVNQFFLRYSKVLRKTFRRHYSRPK